MKRLVLAYLIGLTTCFVSVSIANRPTSTHVNLLFGALLGISSSVADAGHQRMGLAHAVLAAFALSLLFVLAETLRSRSSWIRWMGYGLWLVLIVAGLFWFKSPAI